MTWRFRFADRTCLSLLKTTPILKKKRSWELKKSLKDNFCVLRGCLVMSGSFFLPAADTATFMDKFRVTENYYYFTFTIRRRGRYSGRLFWLLEGSLELLYQIYIRDLEMSQLALILNQVKWPELTGTMTQHGGSSTSRGFNPESCIGSFSSDRFILEGCVSVANRVQLYKPPM